MDAQQRKTFAQFFKRPRHQRRLGGRDGANAQQPAIRGVVRKLAERAGEDMWRLPLNTRLREQLKSPIADMRNTGDRFGGAITAGLFLKTFAKDTPWVHVDIAGPASISNARPSVARSVRSRLRSKSARNGAS